MRIRPYLLAGTICLVPVAGNAADLPTKAAPYYTPPFSWTGFYIGGSGGLISQNTTATDTNNILTGSEYGITGVGGVFGVDAGYNYQMGALVLGIETDISGTSINKTIDAGLGFPFQFSSKLSALGTVRGRIGYAFDHVLLYATGGWAFGHVENAFGAPGDPGSFGSTNDWRDGWAAGGGLEYALLPNWTVRAEGLYVDLGSSEVTNAAGCRFGFKNQYALGRIGLNYKF